MLDFYKHKYNVGNAVQLVRGGQAWVVIWCGHLKVREGTRHGRVNVYRLDNGHWDCYYEEELHSAWRWDK
jgi:hypothetical protein